MIKLTPYERDMLVKASQSPDKKNEIDKVIAFLKATNPKAFRKEALDEHR